MKPDKIKTILLDDELRSLETLQWLLGEYCPQVDIVATFSDPFAAIKLLRKSPPDLLLLDISMPGLNGFDLVYQLFPLSFPVIFVTAHNGPILKALKKTGILFLLKPVDDQELRAVIERANERQEIVSPEQINSFRNTFLRSEE
ncbi:MAG: hypothetical protein DHS20C18_39060 [Saprospiraceae bacterium]|nr:MAG: hypothetical protein DHS20C18_39060 [Saprospiraceae bacterium]